MIETYVLTWMTFVSLVGAAVILCLPSTQRQAIRWTGVAATVPSLLLSVWLLRHFDPGNTAPQFVHRFAWPLSWSLRSLAALPSFVLALFHVYSSFCVAHNSIRLSRESNYRLQNISDVRLVVSLGTTSAGITTILDTINHLARNSTD